MRKEIRKMTGTGNLLQRAIPRLYLAASGTVTNDSVSECWIQHRK